MEENNKIEEFLSDTTDMEKMEDILKMWITRTKDEELRKELSKTLDNRYGVKRKAKKGVVLRHLRQILAIAASLALLFTVYMFNQNDVPADTLATQYLDSQTIQHPGGFKGVANFDSSRTKGIMAFNEGDFKKAALQFEEIVSPNEEDLHYLGLAYLKNGQYQKAIENLKKGAVKTSRYREEANWFLSLAYLLDGQDANAKYWLDQIKKGDWQFEQAQDLLKKVEID